MRSGACGSVKQRLRARIGSSGSANVGALLGAALALLGSGAGGRSRGALLDAPRALALLLQSVAFGAVPRLSAARRRRRAPPRLRLLLHPPLAFNGHPRRDLSFATEEREKTTRVRGSPRPQASSPPALSPAPTPLNCRALPPAPPLCVASLSAYRALTPCTTPDSVLPLASLRR